MSVNALNKLSDAIDSAEANNTFYNILSNNKINIISINKKNCYAIRKYEEDATITRLSEEFKDDVINTYVKRLILSNNPNKKENK